MGIDAGFDMVPRLSRGAVDRQNWGKFINFIKQIYEDDERVEIKPNYIVFKAGEHPRLPFEGHKFLRFSSKISGSHAKGVEEYLKKVTLLAQVNFGSRVRPWNEIGDKRGFYNWHERDELEIPTSIGQYVFGTDPIRELGLELFEIKTIPGKGKGLVARFNIGKGKRILFEKPFFTITNMSPPSTMETNIAKKLKDLSKTEQRQFLSLHNNFPGKYPFRGIVKTNALPCGPDSVVGGVYPTISLINHSCLPNTHHSWNSDGEFETIHATRYIPAGEEITISYDRGGTAQVRCSFLKDNFGFDCDCKICSLPAPGLDMSDTRRIQIQDLDDAIGDPLRVLSSPEDCLLDCYRLLQVLEEEYEGHPGASTARLYYDAFQISITHSDQARATTFAERAYRARVSCEGEDSPATQKMKNMMESPTGHLSFGTSKRWRTFKHSVPEGLTSDEFEKWVWRRAR